jgi:hypothetical protein
MTMPMYTANNTTLGSLIKFWHQRNGRGRRMPMLVRGYDFFARRDQCTLPFPGSIQGAITIPMGFFECLGMLIITQLSEIPFTGGFESHFRPRMIAVQVKPEF